MGYLTNKNINYLNIHIALFGITDQALGLFIPIFLYLRGFSLPEVFLLLMAFNVLRIPFRFFSFPLVHRFGLKNTLIFSTIGSCLSYPFLAQTKGYDIWLLIFLLSSFFSALHWHCHHTFYTLAGDKDHRAKQVSVSQALGIGLSAFVPLLSGLFITQIGFEKYFFLALPLLILMLLALNRCEDIPTKRKPWKVGKKLMFNIGAKIHLAEAAAIFPLNTVWVFVVFFLVEKLVSLGGVVTFGIITQMVYQLWVGRVIDNGNGHRIANIAGILRTLQVFLRAFIPLNIHRALSLEAYNGAVTVHHNLAQPTVMYNSAYESADPFWYWLFAETAFDIGVIFGSGGVAALLYFGVPLQLTILLALPGVLAVWHLTYHYYDKTKK